jgi:hypothetical protein
LNEHKEVLLDLLNDRLEKDFQISEGNLYRKIMDEGLSGVKAYDNLIEEKCLF